MKRVVILLLIFLLLTAAFCEESILPAGTRDTEAVLYYPSTDLTRIVKTQAVISVGDDRLLSTLSALSLPPFAQDVTAALPAEARVSSYENTFDTLVIGLTSSAPVTEEALERYLKCACLTAGENSGVQTVCVMTDGVSSGYITVKGEKALILYLPVKNEDRVVPIDVTEAELSSDDPAGALLNALFSGKDYGYCASYPASAVPDSWHYETAPDGRSTLVIDFSQAAYTVLAVSGVQKWQLMASAALSCCTCLPHTERVLIRFSGNVLNSYTGTDGALISPEGGYLNRDDFIDLISARIRVRDENGQSADGFIPLSACPAPEAVLTQAASLPTGSIRAVRVIDDTAWVDLSGSYLDSVRNLSANSERDTVYRMVNALYENFGVSSVRFLKDGKGAEYFASSIWLGEPLLYNPGF